VALSSRIGTWFPRIAGALLIGLGLFYIWRQLSGHAHSHTHLFSKGGHGGNEHEHKHQHELKESLAHFRAPDISGTRTSDWVAIGSLFAMLAFSPCEAFLPIYVSGIRFGWGGFALLTLILSTAAVAGMLVFTSLALLRIRSIGLGCFERYESLVTGSLLLLVGVMVLLFEKVTARFDYRNCLPSYASNACVSPHCYAKLILPLWVLSKKDAKRKSPSTNAASE